ncbi:MAG: PrsW family glutamic-type intramembrane protease [Oscillospiraceae bacterium]
MDGLILVLFFCTAVPMALMLFQLEKKSRLVVGFMLIGMFMCVFIGSINGFFLQKFNNDVLYVTTTITPITEEIIKALPVLFFAFVFSDKRETLISISMGVGIGFAVMENMYIMTTSLENATVVLALIRGLGAGLMHGICTSAIGIGISFVHKKKKLFYTGTFALLSAAIIYHAIYNLLVQTRWEYAGFLLPIVTYIPLIIAVKNKKKKDMLAAKKKTL